MTETTTATERCETCGDEATRAYGIGGGWTLLCEACGMESDALAAEDPSIGGAEDYVRLGE